MKKTLTILILLISLNILAQSKKEYLRNNCFDLNSNRFDFPQKGFKIIGFGAYHGSAKTEIAENKLLQSLTETDSIKYYLPETDYSIAHYFNEFLKLGDTLMLKDLVYYYGIRVPQESTIEVYNKWKKLKELNDKLDAKTKLTVIGIDAITNYKYPSKHLLELINLNDNNRVSIQTIIDMVKNDTTDFSSYYNTYSKRVLENLVSDYEQNKSVFEKIIKDTISFNHIIKNLKYTFDDSEQRERVIYQNYLDLSPVYHFDSKPQFLRFGFSHIEKSREGENGYPYFFTRLIENGIYNRKEIISVIGYLTESRVLWDCNYDSNGNYLGFTTEGGYGIGDYWKEYFRGIKNLKKTKKSDLTLFRLNSSDSPYNNGKPDLIEIKMFLGKSNGKQVKGMSTLDFLDYALLISNSKASTPIEELK